jgi:hypothetical protein
MKRFYCAGVVGLALLITGAARASDSGYCDNGKSNTFCDYQGNHGDFNFNFTSCGDKDDSHDYSCDKSKYDDCGDKDPCGHSFDNGCHHPDPCGHDPDPVSVPLPPASALGAIGIVMAGAVKWLRSRRSLVA